MENKNLTPTPDDNTPKENINPEEIIVNEVDSAPVESEAEEKTESSESTESINEKTPAKTNGFTEFIRNNKIAVIVIAVLLVAIACGIAIGLVGALGVDTSVATPDESTIETTSESVPSATEAQGTEDTTWPDGTPYEPDHDWDALKKINTDIKGWINVRDTQINYPVLKSEEDGRGYQYYLHRDYDKSYLYAGSIFIDYRSSEGAKSRNILTHGHSMNNGSMYKALIDYGKWEIDLDFYKEHPTLFFDTPEGNEQWIIFAVVKTNTLESHGDFFNYLMGDFDSDAQFMNYVYNMKVRSLVDVDIPINEDDQLITLSTCSYEYDEFRTVICARKLRNNEKVNDYIDNAKANENAVWPDVYYYNNGGTRPEITTFKTELQAGNITWYDGDGELKGNEWLVATTGNKQFTVTFINYDGSIISTQTVNYGKAAVAPPDPVKPDSPGYTYKFIEWGIDFSHVTCNMTVAPKFEAIPVD